MKHQNNIQLVWFAFVLCGLLIAGCEKPSRDSASQHDGGARPESTAANDVPAQSAGNAVSLATLDNKLWETVLASANGHVVVVDTWATWCVPCREEFPHLVDLNEKYSKDGVVCISVSVDSPTEHAAAAEFLREQNANFPNYRFEDDSVDWLDKWNIKGIPVVLVFDSQGKLAKKFDMDDPDNQFSYAEVEELVAKLVSSEL